MKSIGSRLPEALRHNKCALCSSSFEESRSLESSADSFDYVCAECNPDVVISISGSLLADGRYENINNDPRLRQSLVQSARSTVGKQFPIMVGDVL